MLIYGHTFSFTHLHAGDRPELDLTASHYDLAGKGDAYRSTKDGQMQSGQSVHSCALKRTFGGILSWVPGGLAIRLILCVLCMQIPGST